MANTKRTWIYLSNQTELIGIPTYRPSGRGAWPAPARDPQSLVVVIEGDIGNWSIPIRGRQYDVAYLPEAIKLHFGIEPTNFDPTVWAAVPQPLKAFVAERVHRAEMQISQQWNQIANEETMTGVFFGGLNLTHNVNGWNVRIRHVEFSKQLKESGTGADLAIVLDVTDDAGRQAFKSLWLQAKKAERVPTDIFSLPRLADQMSEMQAYTEEAYALVYTPSGVRTVKGNQAGHSEDLGALLSRAMACKAGDPAPELLGDSMSRKHVLAVLIGKANPQ